MSNVNSQFFDKKQIEQGQMTKLLDYLMSEAYDKGDYYNDIHIKPCDCEAFIVEWVQVPWSHEFGGSFQYINDDQVVLTEYKLPDGSYVDLASDDDFKDYLDSWLEENPGWVKTQYGTWTNEIENKKFLEELKKSEEKI